MNSSENRSSAANYNNEQNVFDAVEYKPYGIVWGAVIAGVVVSLVSATLLNFLGLGFGLSAFNLKGDGVSLVLSSGVILWLLVSGILSSLVCGWIAGVFSSVACRFERGCHGAISWGLALLMTLLLTISGAGTALGGVVNLIEQTTLQAKTKMAGVISKNLPEYINNVESRKSNSENEAPDTKDAANAVGVSSLIIFAVLFLSGLASVVGAVFCNIVTHRAPKVK